MPILSGLPGTKRKFEVKEFAHSAAELMRFLKRDGFATAAGDNGSLTIWKDDKGVYRGERCVHWTTRDAVQTDFWTTLRTWVKANYRLIP